MARKPRESAHDLWEDEPSFTGLTAKELEVAQRLWRPMAEACEPRVRATVKEEERKLAWWQSALVALGVTMIAGGVSALVGMVVVSNQADGVQNGKIEVNAEDIGDLRDDSKALGTDMHRLDREVGELGTKVDGMKKSLDTLAKEIREDRVHRQVQNPYAHPGPMSGP